MLVHYNENCLHESKWILVGGEAREKNARRRPYWPLSTFFECNEATGQKTREKGKNFRYSVLKVLQAKFLPVLMFVCA